MAEVNRADIVLARCSRTSNTYGMRFEETQPQVWTVTWAFPVDAAAAAREGYGGGGLRGRLAIDAHFPGCPHCQDMTFVLCGQCDRVSCSAVGATYFNCPWCTNAGPISGHITSLKTVGD
jgi:hypothetical protein